VLPAKAPVTQFWRSLGKATVENDVLTLADGTYFPYDDMYKRSSMQVRELFPKLLHVIMRHERPGKSRRVLLTGPVGEG
jgi:hypothetical protein